MWIFPGLWSLCLLLACGRVSRLCVQWGVLYYDGLKFNFIQGQYIVLQHRSVPNRTSCIALGDMEAEVLVGRLLNKFLC